MNTLTFNVDISNDLYQKNQVVPTLFVPTEYLINNAAWQAALEAAVVDASGQLVALNPALAPLFLGRRIVTPLFPSLGYSYPSVLAEDPTSFLNALLRNQTGAGNMPTYNSITFFVIIVHALDSLNQAIEGTQSLIAVFYYI